MGLLGKAAKGTTKGLGALATLGGLALVTSIMNSESQKEVVYVDSEAEKIKAKAEAEEERREKEHERQMEITRKKAEAEDPNRMDFVQDRLEEADKTGQVCLFAMASCFLYAILLMMAKELVGVFFCALVGMVLAYFYIRSRNKIKKYNDYISMILVHNEKNIMNMASKMNCSYDEALKDVTYIISKGLIRGFSIDKKRRVIIENYNVSKRSNTVNPEDEKVQYSSNNVKKCKYCGASSFVDLFDGRYCKYCGMRA